MALAALIFYAGSWVAPILPGGDAAPGSRALRAVYAPVCHQLPERSLSLAGRPQAVCARCSGLYAGGVLGLFAAALGLATRASAVRAPWLVLALMPTAIDAALPWIGLRGVSEIPRFAISWPAGFVAALLLAAGVVDLVAMRDEARARAVVGRAARPLEDTDG